MENSDQSFLCDCLWKLFLSWKASDSASFLHHSNKTSSEPSKMWIKESLLKIQRNGRIAHDLGLERINILKMAISPQVSTNLISALLNYHDFKKNGELK